VRAIEALPHIARAHVSRWGDGGAHLHVFFLARPVGFAQLRGTFLAVWAICCPPSRPAIATATPPPSPSRSPPMAVTRRRRRPAPR
jgi:hypothetical protein